MIRTVADLHCHTVASTHAYSTILENVTYAKRRRLQCIAITDHAGITDSPHIWHFSNLAAVPHIVEGILVLRGAEVDLLDDQAHLSMSDSAMRGLDWINVSFHRPSCSPKDPDYHTAAYLNAAKNPYVDVIAHSGTDAFRYDYEKGIRAFGEYGKLVELNAGSLRVRKDSQKNCVEIAKLCKKYRVPVVINSDAHFATAVGDVSSVIRMLHEIDFPEELVLNGNAERLFGYIKEKKNIDYYQLLALWQQD